MSDCCIVVLEDFLDINGVVPPKHRAVYEGLASQMRVVVLSTWHERETPREYLRISRLKFDLLMTKDNSILEDLDWKVTMVREVMGMGWPIGVYLDVDPGAIEQVLAMNVPTLLFSHRVLRPSWLPDPHRSPRAWEDLKGFIEDQRAAGPVDAQPG